MDLQHAARWAMEHDLMPDPVSYTHLEGEKVVIANPLEALGRGIAMVHQELQPIPARTVAENIWLGRYPTKKVGPITIVDHSKMYADTRCV